MLGDTNEQHSRKDTICVECPESIAEKAEYAAETIQNKVGEVFDRRNQQQLHDVRRNQTLSRK